MEQSEREKFTSEIRQWCLHNGFDDSGRRSRFHKDEPLGRITIEVTNNFSFEGEDYIEIEFFAQTFNNTYIILRDKALLYECAAFGTSRTMQNLSESIWNKYYDAIFRIQ